VPWTAFEAFEREFERAKAGLEEAKVAVLKRYDAVQANVVETFLRLADDSARRLEATGQPVAGGFREAVVHQLLGTMPSRKDLQDKLILRYRVGVVLLGSEMVAEQRLASEERRQLEEATAAERVERERQAARERVIQQEFWAEEERIRRRLQAEEEERRREAAIKEQLRQLKLEAARERLQETMSPLEEGAKQLHAAIYESAAAIRASLQKHQYLHGSSAKRARELARWFRLMCWQSDEQLEGLLDELERLAGERRARKKHDLKEIDGVLRDIVDLCYADARELAVPHRMAALEI
jgi:ATP-dependent Lon protease